KQWLEGNIAPQVVFEILSPGNRLKEMTKKLQFYDRHGVEEYYIYDPESNDLHGLYRQDKRLNIIEGINNWTSPRLQIRFTLTEETLEIYRPDGQKFLTTLELSQRFEQEHQRAEQEYQRAERLLAQLKALGVEPN
ncbi:MAG: Uma2 family endonuclease, partial [Pseudanabaena sp.]